MPEQTDGEGEDAPIRGFDPAEDAATHPQKTRIADMYDLLVGRGEEAAAEELRREPSLREQSRLARSHREFDPKHDPVPTTSRISIRDVYEALLEAGEEEAAEELRAGETLREQSSLKIRFRNEHLRDSER